MRKLVLIAAIALAACNQAQQPAPEAAATPEAVQAAVTEQQQRFAAARAEPADANTAYQFEFPGLMTERVPLERVSRRRRAGREHGVKVRTHAAI